MRCVVCDKAAPFVCGSCRLIAYCSEPCADIDWSRVHHRDHDIHIADMVLSGKGTMGNLWIGGIDALNTPKIMNQIDAVVTAIHVDRVAECAAEKYYKDRPHMRISIWDEPKKRTAREFASSFPQVGAFINEHIEQGNNVLVHCAAGFSRSVTLSIYYMMHYRGYATVEEALEKIRETRPSVNPNKAFVKVLNET